VFLAAARLFFGMCHAHRHRGGEQRHPGVSPARAKTPPLPLSGWPPFWEPPPLGWRIWPTSITSHRRTPRRSSLCWPGGHGRGHSLLQHPGGHGGHPVPRREYVLFKTFPGSPRFWPGTASCPDRWPKLRGDRLVFSNGIIILAGLSIVLLVVFQGSTHALILSTPLASSSPSRCHRPGMVRHWLKESIQRPTISS